MRRIYQLVIAFVFVVHCGGVFGHQDMKDTTTLLFCKPAFELSSKDHVLLDILQEQVFSDQECIKDLREENGSYPEPFEQAFTYYLTQMGEGNYTRSRHLTAISEAAQYLHDLLFADVRQASFAETRPSGDRHSGECISLLIGINYEHTSSELNNCIRDIDHVLSVLLTPHVGVAHKNVIYMSDHQKGTSYYPTKANILKQFATFASLVNQTKVGYFHYSGHGASVKDASGDELDGKDEALVPVDYNAHGFLIDDDIFVALVKKLTPDVDLLVTTDCCHSGTILDLPYKWKADGAHTVEHHLSEVELKSLPKVVMLSGCKDAQTSADGGPIMVEGEQSGALTGAFLHVLQAHDYHITYRQLLVEVNRYLAQNGFQQKPELTSTYLLDLDDEYMNAQRARALNLQGASL